MAYTRWCGDGLLKIRWRWLAQGEMEMAYTRRVGNIQRLLLPLGSRTIRTTTTNHHPNATPPAVLIQLREEATNQVQRFCFVDLMPRRTISTIQFPLVEKKYNFSA